MTNGSKSARRFVVKVLKGLMACGLIYAVCVFVSLWGIEHLSPQYQVMERVGRIKRDVRSLTTAIESYYIDHQSYPAMRPLRRFASDARSLEAMGGLALMTIEHGRPGGPDGLTTPIAYLPSLFLDPFAEEREWPYAYWNAGAVGKKGWIVWSPGPDRDYDIIDPAAVYDPEAEVPWASLIRMTYDPSNGLKSNGDLWRVKHD